VAPWKGTQLALDLKKIIRNIPDFPKKGIVFRDITPLLGHPAAFRHVVDDIVAHYRGRPVDAVAAIEARGFIFGAAIAYQLGIPFVPIRKRGKLPYRTRQMTYELEYGTDTIEVHEDAVRRGQNVLLVDDLLATGGTMAACCRLIESLGAKVAGIAFVVELSFLNGRQKLDGYDVLSLVAYESE
jgi:adenine phosphoribosyltransferase